MCDWVKSGNQRIDPCLRETVRALNLSGVKTLACCCGHGLHPKTIVVEQQGMKHEYYSNVILTRAKRFYKRDTWGYFFIPEVELLVKSEEAK